MLVAQDDLPYDSLFDWVLTVGHIRFDMLMTSMKFCDPLPFLYKELSKSLIGIVYFLLKGKRINVHTYSGNIFLLGKLFVAVHILNYLSVRERIYRSSVCFKSTFCLILLGTNTT